MSFLDDRLGLDATVYRKQTKDQIVNDIRGSYATGFILFNLNGAVDAQSGTRDHAPRHAGVSANSFSWDISANFDERARQDARAAERAARSRTSPTRGCTATSATARRRDSRRCRSPGLFYLRNNAGPAPDRSDDRPAAPVHRRSSTPATIASRTSRSASRTPSEYKRVSLDFLVDIRRGGDVFNATEHFLTTRGLATSTLDRDTPRVIAGVLRDGKENTANPTPNTIVVIPAIQTAYYTNMSEELFIEKDINWVRLRDVTLQLRAAGALSATTPACSSRRRTSSSSRTTPVSIRSSNGNDGGGRRLGRRRHRLRQLPDSARHQLRPQDGLLTMTPIRRSTHLAQRSSMRKRTWRSSPACCASPVACKDYPRRQHQPERATERLGESVPAADDPLDGDVAAVRRPLHRPLHAGVVLDVHLGEPRSARGTAWATTRRATTAREQWRDVYWSLGQNLVDMMTKAEAEQRWDLLGVGYVLKAWGWQVLTDMHGEIIVKEAIDPTRVRFDYDTQEFAYTEIAAPAAARRSRICSGPTAPSTRRTSARTTSCTTATARSG